MSRYLVAFLCLLNPGPLLAESDAKEVEARLAIAEGRERLELLVELMAAYREHEPRQTVAASAEVFELLRSAPDDDLELSASSSLSGALIRLARYQEALPHASRAERLARSKQDKPALALALNRLGEIFRFQNEYERAREYLFEAIRLFDELGDVSGRGEVLKLVRSAQEKP